MTPTPRLLPVLLAALALGGCAPLQSHWPFRAEQLPPPVAVHELDVVVAADSAMPIVLQFWERNTLVIDLQGVASSGELRLKLRAGATWPVRLAFRAAPGRFEMLEVQGAQRVLFPVSGDRGAAPLTLALSSAAYAGATSELRLRWGVAESF